MSQVAAAFPTRAQETNTSPDPSKPVFVIVSFEGPDPYSQAGGLGVRVTGLSRALAELGHETHLFFIGDPASPPEETLYDGKLKLHRWAQWISANCPGGVYEGEVGKMTDLASSLPRHLVEEIVQPAARGNRMPILLFEEWQTAECTCRVADALREQGIRDRVTMAWNANHCYGFDRIDWRRLAEAATITTVSRHMRSMVRACGVDARVIPNGLPAAALEPVQRSDVTALRSAVSTRPNTGMLFKMARWEREKGWSQALDAVSFMRGSRRRGVLVARSGGPTGGGGDLSTEASRKGLQVAVFDTERSFMSGFADAVGDGAEVVNLRFGVTPSLARSLYAAADGVLANSVMEPFGLVGLEAMAAGGVAYTGGTGEDYAVSGRNAVVLETLDPGEIVEEWEQLASAPERVARLRREAKRTARDYEWRSVVPLLQETLEGRAAV